MRSAPFGPLAMTSGVVKLAAVNFCQSHIPCQFLVSDHTA